jgi:hypothetical protein
MIQEEREAYMAMNIPPMSSAEYQEHIQGIESMSEDAIGTAVDKVRAREKDTPKRPRVGLDVWKGEDHFYVTGYYRKDDSGAGWIDEMRIELIDLANQAHGVGRLARHVQFIGSSLSMRETLLALALEIYEEGK